jgi:serine protease Do
MRPFRFAPAAVAAAVAAAFAVGMNYERLPNVPQAHAAASETALAAPFRQQLPDFSQLVDEQGPAVVFISVTKSDETRGMRGMPELGDNGIPEELLRRFGVPMPKQGPGSRGPGPAPRQAQGVGSGFIVSADGYILTNAHVVDGASEVDVKLADKREFRAKVIGADKKTDVAVVKVEAKGLPTVRIGDTSKLRVGQWVAAIGAPFGLDKTVTAGIVSAKSRALPNEGLVPFIQTDVAVNPGNSGGPLFNLSGEVVGINSQIYSQTGGYMGLSFAIPIEVAMQVKDQLVQYGKVERGRIGVVVQPVNQGLAESFGLGKAEGALVANVEPNGPAAKAGLKSGDVILSWNGKAIESSTDLPLMVASTKPGAQADITVWREGAKRDMKIGVGETPAEKGAKVAGVTGKTENAKLGVAVRPLSGDEAKQLEVDGGLVVEQASGPAAKAGVQQGDVILGVNGKPVKSVDELKTAIESAGKRPAVLVQRGEATIYVPVEIG